MLEWLTTLGSRLVGFSGNYVHYAPCMHETWYDLQVPSGVGKGAFSCFDSFLLLGEAFAEIRILHIYCFICILSFNMTSAALGRS